MTLGGPAAALHLVAHPSEADAETLWQRWQNPPSRTFPCSSPSGRTEPGVALVGRRRFRYARLMADRFRTRAALAALSIAALVRAAAAQTPDMHIPPPLPPCTEYTATTPEDVWKPDADWKKLENTCVRWTLPFKSLRPTGQTALVYLNAPGDRTVTVIAPASDAPWLKSAKPDDKIEVRGRITWIQPDRMALHETTLASPTAPKPDAK
jgi:hypothetical protein